MASHESLVAAGVPVHLAAKAGLHGVSFAFLEQLWTLLKQSPDVACPLLAVLVPQLQEPYKSVAAEVQSLICAGQP